MKIGIITFHKSDNYGSVLQTYALQYYLNNYFQDVHAEVIDYRPPKIERVNSLYEPVKNIKDLVKNIIKFRLNKKYIDRHISFDDFRKQYIKFSDEIYSDSNIEKVGLAYDVIIVGSDQIWNPLCLEFSWSYYLSNVQNCIKIAYAPSLGTCNIDEKQEENIRLLLSEFNYISVREQQGADYLSRVLDQGVDCVPDPTVLLEPKDYEIISNGELKYKDYIFLYVIDTNPFAIHKAINISKKNKIPIYTVLSCANSFRLLKYPSIHFFNHESPADFIAYIKNARIVLTNSFHGTVFSIILKKDFYVLGDLSTNGRDNRINTLLTKLGLLNRCVDIQSIDFKTGAKIDYLEVEKKLYEYRNMGIKYLENAINMTRAQIEI